MLKKAVLSALDRLMQWAMDIPPAEELDSQSASEERREADREYEWNRQLVGNIVAMTSHGNHCLTSGKIVTPEDIERKHRELDELELEIQAREAAFDADCVKTRSLPKQGSVGRAQELGSC